MTQNTSSKLKIYLALLSSLAALATHFYLSRHYFELNLGVSTGSAICNINKTFNCDAVSASRFSSLFGIPIALWGFSLQLVLTLLTLSFCFGFTSDKAKMGRYCFLLSFIATLSSIVMGSISFLALGTFCLFCILAYVLSFIHLFSIYGLQESKPFSQLSSDFTSAFVEFKWVGISVAAIIPMAFLFNGMFLDHFGGSLLKDSVESSYVGWQSAPSVSFGTEGLSKGPADAKNVIVEFADFLCPHCKHAGPSLKLFIESHPDVRLIFKTFPLDGNCNANKDMPKGDNKRCLLATSVFCAEKLAQKGWEFYEDIFDRQEDFYRASSVNELLKPLIEKNNLTMEAFETCQNSEEMHKNIFNQSQEGVTASIEGTPAVFFNGRYLSRGHLLPVLQKVYESTK